jgi:hypothetical protein
MKKFISIIFLQVFFTLVKAQTASTPLWTSAFGLQDTVIKIPTAIDSLKQLYVAGSNIDSISGADILLTKYNENGDILWTATFTGSGNHRDQATTIAIDDNYNIILGGFTYTNSTNNYDYLILKYDSTGSLLWTYTYNGTGSGADLVSALTVDGGNIYLTGASIGSATLFDYTTIKLNNSGNFIWSNRYHYLVADVPFDIDIIGSSVFVNGGSQSSLTDWDYAQITYTTSGTATDTIRTSGTGIGFDHATQAVTDAQGYIYITGTYANAGTGLDFKTIKLNQQGIVKWIKTFNNTSNQNDQANSLAVDDEGNVYVTGETKNSAGNDDYCTIKYDSLGTEIWVRYYNNGQSDKAQKITLDEDKNVYVTGQSSNGSNIDFATLAYTTDGDTLWTQRFNDGNVDNMATNILVINGVVYVSGQSKRGNLYEYKTIAYDQAKYDKTDVPTNMISSNSLVFEENLGQLIGTDGRTVNQVKFYSALNSPQLFFSTDTIHFNFGHNDSIPNNVDTLKRVDMIILGAKMRIFPLNPTRDYQNYYLPQCSSGATNVHNYQKLFAPNIFKNIDVEFRLSNAGLNMFYTIQKETPEPKIEMQFQGADSIYLDQDGNLHIASNGVEEYFLIPNVWQVDASGNNVVGNISGQYSIGINNKVSIRLTGFDTALKTKIAMSKLQMSGCSGIPNDVAQGNIYHSTFYGANSSGVSVEDANDYTTGITTDDEGNIYVTGFTNTAQFPIYQNSNPAPSQLNFGGLKDGTILCFTKHMVRKWTTFMGGSDSDTLTCITFNANDNNIYFGGTTASSNLPTSQSPLLPNSYFDNLYNGGQDAIFGACKKNGELQLNTYIGGSGYDKAMSVCVTGDVIMLTGNTQSTNISSSCTAPSNGSFPTCATAGSFVKAANSGGLDIFLMKFEVDNSLSWSTLIGSNADDKVYDIEPYPVFRSSGANYFYLSGETKKTSNTGPFDGSVLTNGDMPLNEIAGTSFFQSMAGGFIMEFSNLGEMVWGTTVNGTKSFQALTFSQNSIYAVGEANGAAINTCTESSSGIPLCSHSGEYAGGTVGSLYMARFNTGGTLLYSTLSQASFDVFVHPYSNPIDKRVDIAHNTNGDIFILGFNIYDPNYPNNSITPSSPVWNDCYYQPTSNSGIMGDQYDCILLGFSKVNQQNITTWFGGNTNFTNTSAYFYPYYSEFPGAIACFENTDLWLAGYSGKECSHFPLVDAGLTPTGQSYFYDDVANSNGYSLFEVDNFITKFDMAALGVGIENKELSNNSKNYIYPSITSDFTNVYLNAEFSSSVNIMVLDGQGKVISTKSIQQIQNESIYKIDLTALSKGIYIIRIIGNNGITDAFKVVKK